MRVKIGGLEIFYLTVVMFKYDGTEEVHPVSNTNPLDLDWPDNVYAIQYRRASIGLPPEDISPTIYRKDTIVYKSAEAYKKCYPHINQGTLDKKGFPIILDGLDIIRPARLPLMILGKET